MANLDNKKREKRKEEEYDIFEDITLISGLSFTISVITLLRNISVLIGRNFLLAGNVNMYQTQTDLWRYIFFVLNIINCIILIIYINKNKSTKIKKYIKSFIIGFIIVIGIEIFFYFLHNRLV